MSKRLEPVWLWIKNYQHPLRVVGGVCFALALVTAVFWMSGLEAEPIAFTLGMVSSLLLAAPSIAEYFMPQRKPVRHMDSDEILDLILTTDPVNDWRGVTRAITSERFLKEDPRLRFKTKFIEDGIQNKEFVEDWANRHPDNHATSFWYELYYDGALLERYILVSIDGGRAELPLPERNTSVITKRNYHIGKIHDSNGTLDEYILRSGLEVEEL